MERKSKLKTPFDAQKMVYNIFWAERSRCMGMCEVNRCKCNSKQSSFLRYGWICTGYNVLKCVGCGAKARDFSILSFRNILWNAFLFVKMKIIRKQYYQLQLLWTIFFDLRRISSTKMDVYLIQIRLQRNLPCLGERKLNVKKRYCQKIQNFHEKAKMFFEFIRNLKTFNFTDGRNNFLIPGNFKKGKMFIYVLLSGFWRDARNFSRGTSWK